VRVVQRDLTAFNAGHFLKFEQGVSDNVCNLCDVGLFYQNLLKVRNAKVGVILPLPQRPAQFDLDSLSQTVHDGKIATAGNIEVAFFVQG